MEGGKMKILTKEKIETVMNANKVDSKGRPVGEIIYGADGFGHTFVILPEYDLLERITDDMKLNHTRFAVYIEIGTCFHQRITPFYDNYGYAVYRMNQIIDRFQRLNGEKKVIRIK